MLSRYLEVSGLTQRALAARARVSPASLSRYVGGKTRPSRSAVTALDTALGASGALLEVWERTVTEDLPPFLRSVATLEAEAVRIDLVTAVALPGLLWCESYAAEVYRSGRKVQDVEHLARLRSERLGELTATVSAVFPLTALLAVPEPVRAAQVEHLLNLPPRVTFYVIPERSVLLGVPGPFSLYRLRDGREVATSDHLEDDAVYGDGVLPRVRDLLRDALALALPAQNSRDVLRGMQQ